MHVYDTSALIELFDKTKKGKKIQETLGNKPIITTAISIHELLVGAQDEKELFTMRGLLQTFSVLDFDAKAAEFSALIEKQLIKERKKVKDADLFISAICVQHDTTLVTCDKDFKKVEGLNVEFF